VLFGAAWGNAIPYLRALSVAYLMQAVLHPLSTTLQLLEYQVTAVLWQIGRLTLLVGGVLLAWHAGMSALAALWIASLVQAACCLVLLGLMAGAIEQVVTRQRNQAIAVPGE